MAKTSSRMVLVMHIVLLLKSSFKVIMRNHTWKVMLACIPSKRKLLLRSETINRREPHFEGSRLTAREREKGKNTLTTP